ncbi:hypothetical protein DFS34DRAFT_398657 [Phlyctochytrium arcticum]|nr:hypothetical protein DFS34DRAFT_398657 [Phlyctochytrium arcticum]
MADPPSTPPLDSKFGINISLAKFNPPSLNLGSSSNTYSRPSNMPPVDRTLLAPLAPISTQSNESTPSMTFDHLRADQETNDRLLESCSSEPIHIPGSVQSYGLLIVFDQSSQKIQITSDNITSYLGTHNTPEYVFSKVIEDLITPKSVKALRRILNTLKDAESGSILTLSLEFWRDDRPPGSSSTSDGGASTPVPRQSRVMYTTMHTTGRNPGLITLDCEPKEYFDSFHSIDNDPNHHFFFMQTLIHQFNAATSQEELIRLAVSAVAEVTEYDRVMMYLFDADWHGHVIEEEMREGLDKQRYLGLHFPATDIPKQARDLYLLNKLRVLANRDAPPSKLVGAPTAPPNPLDLSFSSLRAVSPVHLKYLENMGVVGTMSIAVMVSNNLWGLIACHHYEEQVTPYQVRSTCLYISSLLSTSLENLEYGKREKQRKQIIHLAGMRKVWEVEDAGLETGESDRSDVFWDKDSKTGTNNFNRSASSSAGSITSERSLANSQSLARITISVATMDEFLGRVVPEVSTWVKADYAMAHYNGKTLFFNVPPAAEEAVQRYIRWAQTRPSMDVIVTMCIKEHLEGFENPEGILAGAVHLPISEGGTDWIAWFAVEQLLHVEWGGAKDKAANFNPETKRIEPRTSFEAWKETVTDHSKPWDQPLCQDRDLMSTLQVILTNVLNSWRSHLLRVAHFEAMDRNARLVLEQKMKKEAIWRKNMLLNHVSHELRTPLHTIRAALGLLVDDTPSNSGHRELLDEAAQANEELTRLIDHLMKYTEVDDENHNNQAQRTPNGTRPHPAATTIQGSDPPKVFDPANTLKSVIANLLETLRKRNREQTPPIVDVDLVEHDVPVQVAGNQRRFKDVCEGLISNALKWSTDRNVRVTLGTWRAEEGEEVPPAWTGNRVVVLELGVQDWGLGIPTDKQHLLFQQFQPLEETLNRPSTSRGLGLGLSMVKKFTTGMNGTVHFESTARVDASDESVPTGTIFTVRIPFEIDEHKPDTPQPESSVVAAAAAVTKSIPNLADTEAFQRIVALLPDIERMSHELPQIKKIVGGESSESITQGTQTSAKGSSTKTDSVGSISGLGRGRTGSVGDQSASTTGTPATSPVAATPAPAASTPIPAPSTSPTRTTIATRPDTKPGITLLRPTPINSTITIPRASSPASNAGSAGGSDSQPSSPDKLQSTRPPLATTKTQIAATPLCCLVVEDNQINQNLLKRQLTRRGHTVLTADDGVQAVSTWDAKRDSINVILMDLAMPNMDGFDATTKILELIADTSGKRVPIIAVTAQAFAGNRELCFARGMDGYVTKPVDMDYLSSIMEEGHWKYENARNGKSVAITTGHEDLRIVTADSYADVDKKLVWSQS